MSVEDLRAQLMCSKTIPRGLTAVALVLVACSNEAPDKTPVTAAGPVLALTPTEFNNSVRDLFGMPMQGRQWPEPHPIADRIGPQRHVTAGVFASQAILPPPWPWLFPAEAGVEEFEGIAEGQQPSPFAIEAMQKAATFYASYALLAPNFFTCPDWATRFGAEQDACSWSSLKRFAQRAWRRPLAEDEHVRLQSFWQSNRTAGTAEEAVVFTVSGILQSPAFLFRVEHGQADAVVDGSIPLRGWEMASRLSYFLWDSMPDAELFGAAANGVLDTPEGIQQQARRMLADRKARAALVHFHNQWLGTEKVQGINPARRAFADAFGVPPQPPLDTTGDSVWPTIIAPLRHSMEAETNLFIEDVLFQGLGTFRELLTSDIGYVSERTRPLYGDGTAPRPGPVRLWQHGFVAASQANLAELTLTPVRFPNDQRAGVLTLPSVLATGAYAVQPGPILRGKLILERLGCQSFPTPPPGAEASLPPDTPEAQGTNRMRTHAATSPAECTGCHSSLNAPGFAFESYDALGRHRTQDNGQAVDTAGSVTLADGESFQFSDGVDLAYQLASSRQLQDCYVLRWARYATGIQIEADAPGLSALQQGFASNDDIKELLVSIAASDLFRMRPVANAELSP